MNINNLSFSKNQQLERFLTLMRVQKNSLPFLGQIGTDRNSFMNSNYQFSVKAYCEFLRSEALRWGIIVQDISVKFEQFQAILSVKISGDSSTYEI